MSAPRFPVLREVSEYDKLRERVEYLEGLTDGDVKLITKLQEEIMVLKQKLKTISRMLDKWEKTTSHPDATLVNIRNLKKIFTENAEMIK